MSNIKQTRISLRKGLKSDLPSHAPIGEPLYCIDTEELYVGQGDDKSPKLLFSSQFKKLDKVANILKDELIFKGCNFYIPYNTHEYGDYKTIINKIKASGCNSINFCIRLAMQEKTSNELTREALDTDVLNYVNYANSLGLIVGLKFHISGASAGGSANIQPTNKTSWIQSLQQNALHYCDLLGSKIKIICLSNECINQTKSNYEDWKNYNDSVKRKNPNYVTTTACTDTEMLTTVLYDIVDYIGVNLYIGIGGDLSTPQHIRDLSMYKNYADGEDKLSQLFNLSSKLNKPILITEVGCTPCVEALKYPAKWDYTQFVENQEAQKLYYETFLKCFTNSNSIQGIFLWCATDGFSYLGKEAESVVRKYFGGDTI